MANKHDYFSFKHVMMLLFVLVQIIILKIDIYMIQ